MTLAAVCYALSVCAQDNKRIAPSTLSEGDLLFCVAESDNNITDVTTGLEGKRIDHVAIFHRKDGQGFALEAIHKGVCLSPIDSFLTRRQNVMVAQLKTPWGWLVRWNGPCDSLERLTISISCHPTAPCIAANWCKSVIRQRKATWCSSLFLCRFTIRLALSPLIGRIIMDAKG